MSEKAQEKAEYILISEAVKDAYDIAKYPAIFKEFADKFEGFASDKLVELLFMRTKTCKLMIQRMEDAREVIDLVAEELDLSTKGHSLYAPILGESVLVEKIRQYLDRGGDKAKLKKRVDELENENRLLRSLVGK